MSKVLVAYFSASGVTAKVASKISEASGADLFEIVPSDPYTKADLNWMNKRSRSSVEMNDRSSRPAISSHVENMEQYDKVFIGFPIWWYREPSIIDTFIESYDFGGKTVIPFATSGGSGLGDTSANLKALAQDADIKEGRRFSVLTSSSTLKEWADQFLKS